MKSFKLIYNKLLIFAVSTLSLISLEAKAHSAELIFANYSNTRNISLQVYPVGMIMNGYLNYDFHSRYTSLYNTNSGSTNGNNIFSVMHNSTLPTINQDFSGATGGNRASVGFGKYKIVVNWGSGMDTCTAEWDYGYSYAPAPFTADLSIIFRDDNNNPRVNFIWSDGSQENPISSFNKTVVAWDQQTSTGNVRRLRPKDYGNFVYDNSNGNNYTIFPQDSRRDCGLENQAFDDNRSGNLTLNLSINKNVFTPTLEQMWDFPTLVNVNPNVTLNLNNSCVLDFTEVIPYYPGEGFQMFVKPQANLSLGKLAKIIIRNHNILTLENSSYLTLNVGSEIRVKPGGLLCTMGGFITGPGHIVYEGGNYRQCTQTPDVITISNGAKICLESDAVLEIPDNSSMHFKGEGSSLIMSKDSKILFGKNSKIIFEEGSKLITKEDENNFTSAGSYTENSGGSLSGKDLLNNMKAYESVKQSEAGDKENYDLGQNTPNPFNPETKINYRIPADSYVTLKVFDMTGREINTMVNAFQKAGEYKVSFDGSNFATGVYYYKITAGAFVSIRKMILIK